MFASLMLSLMLFESPIQGNIIRGQTLFENRIEWTFQDALWEKSNGIYVGNNPINWTDPLGLWSTGIHNDLIDDAFSDSSEQFRNNLKSASKYVDEDQSLEGSYKHAMRAPGQSIADAQRKYDEYLIQNIKDFAGLSRQGKCDEAQRALGRGMHSIMDSTSPSHKGFQVWEGAPNALEGIAGFLTGIYSSRYKHSISHVNGELSISDPLKRETVDKMRNYYRRAMKELDN